MDVYKRGVFVIGSAIGLRFLSFNEALADQEKECLSTRVVFILAKVLDAWGVLLLISIIKMIMALKH